MSRPPSYEETLATGQLSSDINCAQYLIHKKILPTHWRCSFGKPMTTDKCSMTKYRVGCCCHCSCGRSASLRLTLSIVSYRTATSLTRHISTSSTSVLAAHQFQKLQHNYVFHIQRMLNGKYTTRYEIRRGIRYFLNETYGYFLDFLAHPPLIQFLVPKSTLGTFWK